MKAWMGFFNLTVYCRTAVAVEVWQRIERFDPDAKQGDPFLPGIETIRLSRNWGCETMRDIRNSFADINGIRVPTAAEIEADAHRKPVGTEPAPSPLAATERGRTSPDRRDGEGSKPVRRIPPPVRGLTGFHVEPDGAAGYAHTIESRYGVPVGADWRKPLPLITLYHPAMFAA